MTSETPDQIPCLSLRDGATPAFVADLNTSLASYGFVALSDHGLPLGLRNRVFEAVQKYFALPESEKMADHVPSGAGARGYTPFGVEVAKDQSLPDLKEFFHVGRERVRLRRGQRDATGAQLEALSDFPPNIWPNADQDLRASMLQLFDALEEIGVVVLEAIARGLDLDPDYFADKVDVGNSILRAIHYPPLETPTRAVRAAAHEDINLITLLVGSEQPGLEVQRKSGEWITAPGGDDLIICNVGDMLERLTNHVLVSTTHRVINPPPPWASVSRYSLPFFLHPNSDFLIETLPSCISAERPNRYPRPILANDFLRQRLVEIGLLKA